jgi:AraC family transcriptional regulator, transcriptional activator of pobA
MKGNLLMVYSEELKENTYLMDINFPFNIFHNCAESHNVLKLHWHENIEIIYMLKGHAIFNIGNKSIDTLPGDMLFVNSGLLHSGYSIDNTYVEFYALVLNKSLLMNQSPDTHYMKYIAPFINGKLLFPDKVDSSLPHYKSIKNSIDAVLQEFSTKLPGFELSIKAHLHLLLISVFRNHSFNIADERDRESYVRDIARFKELFTYVEKHFSEKISLDTAARLVNLSPHHFCKTFKKITGRTFVDFLNLYRVNAAEELLRKTTFPITEISERVGFCNINYFDKIFKQYKRYSPSKCRKD